MVISYYSHLTHGAVLKPVGRRGTRAEFPWRVFHAAACALTGPVVAQPEPTRRMWLPSSSSPAFCGACQ
ncbi:hypothetical protein PsYK624_008650 [Phanerochaete sordida]|uniref:Uncharacterized protein n=1 Tax=Phanerochaete sordida TaxID=48140 RepID=A0A9P3L7T3_9APHY|nr:hypothetical protein PsYK624_008650 [Phanerochaete sordida]